MTIRRDAVSRAELMIPTRDSAYRTIGNSISSPNTRNIVVTKSKYGGRREVGDEDVVREARRKRIANGRIDVGDRTPRAKKNSASGIHGRSGAVLRRREARRDERPQLVQQDRHRQDDPDHDRDPERDREAVARPEQLEREGCRPEAASTRIAGSASREEPDRRPDDDREDRPDQPGPELGQVVDERHHPAARRRGAPRARRPARVAGRRSGTPAPRTASASAISGQPVARSGGRGGCVVAASRRDDGRGRDGRGGAAPRRGVGVGAAASVFGAGACRGRRGAGAAGGGSGLVSTRAASVMSVDALRNSRMLLPRAAPTSGRRPGPITTSAITRMRMSSTGPMFGMGCGSTSCLARGRRRAGDALARVARAVGGPVPGGCGDGPPEVPIRAIRRARRAAIPRETLTSRPPPGHAPAGAEVAGPSRENRRLVAALRPDAGHQEREARRDRPDLRELVRCRRADDQPDRASRAPPRRAAGDAGVQRLAPGAHRRVIRRHHEALELGRRPGSTSGTGHRRTGRASEERRDRLLAQVRVDGDRIGTEGVEQGHRLAGGGGSDVAALRIDDDRDVRRAASSRAARGRRCPAEPYASKNARFGFTAAANGDGGVEDGPRECRDPARSGANPGGRAVGIRVETEAEDGAGRRADAGRRVAPGTHGAEEPDEDGEPGRGDSSGRASARSGRRQVGGRE